MVRGLLLRAVSVAHRLSGRGRIAGAAISGLPASVRVDGPGATALYGLLALAAPAFFFLYGLGDFPLRDNNEGLYAEIAREMLASGQFIVPHLNGVPYIEKPPLLYWLISLSMSVLGPSAAAARLVSAAAMLGLCACLFQFCRLHGELRTGCFANVGLASAIPVALVSHLVLFDPLLTALIGASLLSFLHSYMARQRRALLLAAFLLALAVLDKGGVALVLAGGIAGVFFLLMRDRTGWRRVADPAGLAIVVAVAGSWHLAAALRQDGFSWFYFINEHLLRFLGRREPHDYHSGSLYFYLARLPLMLAPWSPFLLLLFRPTRVHGTAGCTIVRFCQAWIVFPLVFFSVSEAKADYYLLVTAPALALWLAIEVARRVHSGDDRPLAWCWGLTAATAVVLLVTAPGAERHGWGGGQLGLLALAWVTLAVVAARFFAGLRSARGREAALLAIAVAAAPALVLLCRMADQRSVRDSSCYVARNILERPQPLPMVFVYRDFEDAFSTLPFYLGRTVPVIESASSDLQFGCARLPERGCISAAHFRRIRAQAPVTVVVRANRATEFLAMAGGRRWDVEWVGDRMIFSESTAASARQESGTGQHLSSKQDP